MPSSPVISVVMPVHNGQSYVEEAVDSILRQTFTEFELLIIDDGSADRTPDLLKAYAKKDDRVKLLRQDKSGYTIAIKRGCEVARGRYIARMDADDVAVPDRFEKQTAFLTSHTHIAAVGGVYQPIDTQGKFCGAGTAPPLLPKEVAHTLQRGGNCLAHPTMMIRRSALEAVGGYREALEPCEDYDLWLRLSEQGDLANIGDLLLYYRMHPASVTSRAVRQQATARLVALRAARVRRAGGSDPLDGVVQLGPEVLAKLDITEQMVLAHVAAALRGKASQMLIAGYTDAASSLLEELDRLKMPFGLRIQIRPEAEFVRARIYMRRRRYSRAFACATGACVFHPWFMGSLLIKTFRVLLRRLRRPFFQGHPRSEIKHDAAHDGGAT